MTRKTSPSKYKIFLVSAGKNSQTIHLRELQATKAQVSTKNNHFPLTLLSPLSILVPPFLISKKPSKRKLSQRLDKLWNTLSFSLKSQTYYFSKSKFHLTDKKIRAQNCLWTLSNRISKRLYSLMKSISLYRQTTRLY